MKPSEEIDKYIALHPDWRGDTLKKIRGVILKTEPEITEDWKYMGSPVWSKDGVICIGNIFKNKVQIVFQNGAFLDDPDKVFNAGLSGKKWRYIDIYEGQIIEEEPLKKLIKAAISYNQTGSRK